MPGKLHVPACIYVYERAVYMILEFAFCFTLLCVLTSTCECCRVVHVVSRCLILYLQNYLLYWQLFVIKGLVHDEVALLLSVLSTALWLLGSDAPTTTQVDQAESMLHFFGKHVSEWFGA